ncbi:MAG: LPS assembly lipoprotein LptE [Brachymonas sp.]
MKPVLNPSRRATLLAVSASALALSGCGFALRGAANLPFNAMYANFAESSSLGQELRRSLEASDVRVITDSRQLASAQVVLEVLLDQREKTVVGVNASGQVREFQLRTRFKFRLRTKEGKELIPETELLQQRDISFNESGALAKESEEAILYRSMQSDIVQQALRRFSSVKQL